MRQPLVSLTSREMHLPGYAITRQPRWNDHDFGSLKFHFYLLPSINPEKTIVGSYQRHRENDFCSCSALHPLSEPKPKSENNADHNYRTNKSHSAGDTGLSIRLQTTLERLKRISTIRFVRPNGMLSYLRVVTTPQVDIRVLSTPRSKGLKEPYILL